MANASGMTETKTQDPNTYLQDILSENKGMAKVFNANNTKVIFALPERTKMMNDLGIHGGLEYWPMDEKGVGKYTHPTMGKTNALEIHDPALMKNPEALKAAIYGDLFHGMNNDPTFNKMREEFKVNYSPAEKQRMENGTSWWDDANGKGASDAAIHDAYIRGVDDPSFMDGVTSGKLEYSAKQQDILKNMLNYIKTGEAR